MTTDKTPATLATVKHGGCVQLGDGLLRNRTPTDYAIEHAGYLATAAQRLLAARGELDALVMRREEEDDVDDGDMHAAQECVDEASTGVRSAIYDFEKRRDRALSAQPSPGGQGDGLVESLVQVMNAQYDGLGYLPADVLGVLNMAVEALAARQPVCATVKDSLTVGGGQAAGEPITVEAVAEIFNDPEYGLSINWLLENGIGELQVGDVLMVSDRAITDEDGSGEVYAAPPAQAVDLGLLDDIASDLHQSSLSDDYEPDQIVFLEAIYKRLRALIDSQAVGNG